MQFAHAAFVGEHMLLCSFSFCEKSLAQKHRLVVARALLQKSHTHTHPHTHTHTHANNPFGDVF